MPKDKEILVVTPDQYKHLARSLTHAISKLSDCSGKWWSISQYEASESQLSGSQYALFLGNADENSLTRDFLRVISNLKNQAGACYGSDGPKAVVFGEGKLQQESEFKNIQEIGVAAAAASAGSVMAGLVAPIIAFPWWYWVIRSIWNSLKRNARERKLRMEQTQRRRELITFG